MSADMEKIIEITLAKIEKSKTQKVVGKSSLLHRSLLVNTLLNRVRGNDKSLQTKTEHFMNYREPRNLVELELDDYDMRVPSAKDTRNFTNIQQQHAQKKQSLLVTKLNTRSNSDVIISSGKTESLLSDDATQIEDLISDTKENRVEDVPCECNKLKACIPVLPLSRQGKKRIHSVEFVEDDCPTKKLRCIWPSNVSSIEKDVSYSVSSLASLFGGLVANTADTEMSFRNKLVSAMVAC